MSVRRAVLTLALCCAILAACGPRSTPAPRIPRAVLKIVCDTPGATLWIDEAYVGPVRSLRAGVRVAAGTHRVEVRSERHHTRYLDVTLAPGEQKTIEVTLPEALP